MMVRRVAAVASLALLAAGAYAPATAAPKPKKKPISKTYELTLAPLFTENAACSDENLEGISLHTETIKPTGPGLLSVKVTGFQGDWDIAIKDANNEEIAAGSGSSTPNPG